MEKPNFAELSESFRAELRSVISFWLKHGVDSEFGGVLTSLGRDGQVIDTDKSVWFQGRAGWMFATLITELPEDYAANEALRAAAISCVTFLRQHCRCKETGKYYFSVTRDGKPLRMRRYVYSESFAAIAFAAVYRITGDDSYKRDAIEAFELYLKYSFEPGVMQPKFESTRPMRGAGPLMIAIVTAQELRACLSSKTDGEISVQGKSCTAWIASWVDEIERYFVKPDIRCFMEAVGIDGSIQNHADGRTLNPGHAIECAWFLLAEATMKADVEASRLRTIGLSIIDWMWERGWDKEHGGLLYFVDVYGLPVQEYWHDMKFWWNHCEVIIATLMAYQQTGDPQQLGKFLTVKQYTFDHFPDREFGEWFGYLHRDGTVSQPAKGNMFKGPFHIPRMLMICSKVCAELSARDDNGRTS